jgi:hypothetical protein
MLGFAEPSLSQSPWLELSYLRTHALGYPRKYGGRSLCNPFRRRLTSQRIYRAKVLRESPGGVASPESNQKSRATR